MNFIDEAKIYVKAGNGGRGCVSFHRTKYISKGGPDGGNGGKGGDIIIVSDHNVKHLGQFTYQKHFRAKNGNNGKGENKTGKSADSLIINVPIGTSIYLSAMDTSPVYDFIHHNQKIKIIAGGRGGLGNTVFKSSINQSPKKFTYGQITEEISLILKLKTLADIGIIGLPNAGKSTFFSKVTSGYSKIADYPFTTVIPKFGFMRYRSNSCTIADIPGLIKDAHIGSGLGFRFLKHIERCSVLVHLIDITCEDLIFNYHSIRNELKLYSSLLANKIEIIFLNKIDKLSQSEVQRKASSLSNTLGKEVFIISSHQFINLSKIQELIFSKLTNAAI
ncbi:Obg family GTPase CgtA [Rickettsia endosymbiont of Cardiosporidium cionae]|uniref:Obg family GTPase CgtA n=1 Tax=Rickettsia endosymbiont of Cardiosporidium cionae TaxID=2777155 RepID=UPI001894CF7E|nr:GTPase ObgE [Rickettsia endosymbiont of Cardiosporidium cionae]KAF8818544.1 GTPase ObgE [Rickettsia endosymbiont of Cardiosporidium cionae]